jgi:hypothetical protein
MGRARADVVFGVDASPSSCSSTTSSSSTASSTTAHAPTASVATVVSTLMHTAATASARLVLDLLLLDHFDYLIWYSEVFDLSHVSNLTELCKHMY